MISSTLKVIGCVMAVCLIAQAQNPATKTKTASISGKILAKGNGIAGVPVIARARNVPRRDNAGNVATTDQDGNYRLENLAPAEYDVGPAAPQYVVAGYQPMKRVILGEGENVEGFDFTVVRGGAVTGKVTDADGRPVIEELIEAIGPEGTNQAPFAGLRLYFAQVTDDRGIYRVFGLAPGKYKIAAGTSERAMPLGNARRSVYAQTYHPSTSEVAKATVIEITEGGEVTNVDIVLRRSQPTFNVTARIVDAETGKPLPDLRIGLQKFFDKGSISTSGPITNRLGEVKLENLTPGKYALSLDESSALDRTRVFDTETKFEVTDQDITSLVLKASTTGKLSGVVVFEGMDQTARSKINNLTVSVTSMTEGSAGFARSTHGAVNADGSFTVGGLRPGSIELGVRVFAPGRMNEFEITRIERDGVVLPRLEIKERGDVGGLRLIVRPRTGGIHGLVKFENGQLSQMPVHVHAKRIGDDNGGGLVSLELDDRGRFVSQGMTPGVYEITVIAYTRNYRGQPPTVRQQVVVADNQITEVTLTLNLKPDD